MISGTTLSLNKEYQFDINGDGIADGKLKIDNMTSIPHNYNSINFILVLCIVILALIFCTMKISKIPSMYKRKKNNIF